MRFTKFIIAAQIELIWGKIHILRKRHSLSEEEKRKILQYKATADRLGVAYEVLSGLR